LIHKNQIENDKEDGQIPSYFFEEKERRDIRTSGSAVCEVPMTIGRVVCSQQNEIKNPEMGLHFNGIKPPRPDSANARLDTPPIPAGRRGDDASGAGKTSE
jgi:hypothetical protein